VNDRTKNIMAWSVAAFCAVLLGMAGAWLGVLTAPVNHPPPPTPARTIPFSDIHLTAGGIHHVNVR
jgi:hypothetical protein